MTSEERVCAILRCDERENVEGVKAVTGGFMILLCPTHRQLRQEAVERARQEIHRKAEEHRNAVDSSGQ